MKRQYVCGAMMVLIGLCAALSRADDSSTVNVGKVIIDGKEVKPPGNGNVRVQSNTTVNGQRVDNSATTKSNSGVSILDAVRDESERSDERARQQSEAMLRWYLSTQKPAAPTQPSTPPEHDVRGTMYRNQIIVDGKVIEILVPVSNVNIADAVAKMDAEKRGVPAKPAVEPKVYLIEGADVETGLILLNLKLDHGSYTVKDLLCPPTPKVVDGKTVGYYVELPPMPGK